MKCVFVDPEFSAIVDGYCEVNYPHLRLGARTVDKGTHKGKGFVPVDIIGCTPEWTTMFGAFVQGHPTFAPETTVSLLDPYGKVWTYTVYEIANTETLFNAPAAL